MAEETTDNASGGTDIMSLITGAIGMAASATPVGAALSAIPSLFKLGTGLFQNSQARGLARNLQRPKYPTYNIPPEVLSYLKGSQLQALNTKLPGQDLIENKLSRSTSSGVHATQESGAGSGEILNNVSSLYGKEMDNVNDLGIKGAENYNANQDKLNQALLTMANFKDKKFGEDLKAFDYNENQPYQNTAASVSALRNASGKNIYGGINDLSSMGSMLSLSGLYGKGGASAGNLSPLQKKLLLQKLRSGASMDSPINVPDPLGVQSQTPSV